MAPRTKDRSLLAIVRKDLPLASKAFKRISQFLLESPEDFMRKPLQELATASNVSEPSLIRFCRHYGYNGMPDFRLALAVSKVSQYQSSPIMRLEPSIVDRSALHQNHKKAIAKCAREFVTENDSIIIDSGSTMSLFAETLKSAPALRIFTTGLNVLEILWGCKQHQIMLPGGIVRFDASALTGRMVDVALQDMHFDVMFMGAGSILPHIGLSTFDEEEAHQNRTMIKAADRLIILVDSSKFKQSALHKICSLERIHAVITDKDITAEDAEMLHKANVKLIIAQ